MSAALVFAATFAVASAQETVDVGVVKQSDIKVVQRLLYPKEDRTEMGLHLGWMPFDALLTTPFVAASFTTHRSEALGFGGWVGAGYGFKNARYLELEGPAYGVAADAYRYLGSATFGVEWSPIYAKMTTNGARIWHYDGFVTARAGASFEVSAIRQGGTAIAPTVSIGVGTRVFMGDNAAIRIALTDDALLEHRQLTDKTYFKQNVGISVGWSILTAVRGKSK